MLATYLPLLLMAVLALGTWWLVKNTPSADGPRDAAPVRSEPDYTMQNFVVERFDKDGRLKVRIQGEQLRHYADTDRIEVDQARIRAVAADGRATLAQARRAITNGDGSELQLLGDARIDSTGPRGEPIEFRGEFLHAFLTTERMRSHLPVTVCAKAASSARPAWTTTIWRDCCNCRAACARCCCRPPAPPDRPKRPTSRPQARRPEHACRTHRHRRTPPLVFITGASSGIGQALALRFHRAGWRLALVARRGDGVAGLGRCAGLRPGPRARLCGRRARHPRHRRRPAATASRTQGLPDAVVANAGISVGMDSAEFDDLEVMRGTFETNNLGMAATFHPFVKPMRAARQRPAGGHRQRRRHPRPARARRVLRQQGGGHQLLRKPARRMRAFGRQGGDASARLHRHATDTRQPLFDALPDAGR